MGATRELEPEENSGLGRGNLFISPLPVVNSPVAPNYLSAGNRIGGELRAAWVSVVPSSLNILHSL